MYRIVIFGENEWSNFGKFVDQHPDLRITSAQACYLIEFLKNKSVELIENVVYRARTRRTRVDLLLHCLLAVRHDPGPWHCGCST